MKKSEIVSLMKEENPAFTEEQLNASVEAVFLAISEALSHNKRVEIRGFGAFSVKEKPARMGRNPRTGEPVEIMAKRAVYFKPGKDLKQFVNE